VKLTRQLLATGFASLCLTPFTLVAEKAISESDLPMTVRRTADELSKGAIVKGYSQDKESGKVEYEVEMTIGSHSMDVTIAPDGSLMEVEEQVEMTALPTAVQSGLKAKAGKGSITKVESITKKGNVVAYEAQVKTGAKLSEIQVGPDGMPLTLEE
jgi:hypothetical protein